MTPKSPDKCAEQAAKRVCIHCGIRDKLNKVVITEIITESYAPTIQVAREAIDKLFEYYMPEHIDYMSGTDIGTKLKAARERL